MPEEQEIEKRDNTTEERNSDDFVHNTNSDDEPDAESTIESDDSPIASETTTGISPETSNTFNTYSKTGKLRLHCAGVNTDVDLQKLCANGDLFLLLFLFGLLCFLYCLRAFQ